MSRSCRVSHFQIAGAAATVPLVFWVPPREVFPCFSLPSTVDPAGTRFVSPVSDASLQFIFGHLLRRIFPYTCRCLGSVPGSFLLGVAVFLTVFRTRISPLSCLLFHNHCLRACPPWEPVTKDIQFRYPRRESIEKGGQSSGMAAALAEDRREDARRKRHWCSPLGRILAALGTVADRTVWRYPGHCEIPGFPVQLHRADMLPDTHPRNGHRPAAPSTRTERHCSALSLSIPKTHHQSKPEPPHHHQPLPRPTTRA